MKQAYAFLVSILFLGSISPVLAGNCAGMNLGCQSIRDYDQCVNKQYGCTWFSGGGLDGCYGESNKCRTIGSEGGCEGHKYCSWSEELVSEKEAVPPTLEEALEIVIIAKSIPMPKDPSTQIKMDRKNITGKIFNVNDITAAKAVLNEYDIRLDNGKCCKKGAGPIPDRTDACYIWSNKFCHIVRTSELCSAASDACPSEIDTSALIPCDPDK